MLSPRDVWVDSHSNPGCLTILLKCSKCDPFAAGVFIHVGRTGQLLCPVAAMLAYLAIRLPSPGPLFIFQDGSPLSRNRLVSSLTDAIRLAGLDASHYSGHSFRVGAATSCSSKSWAKWLTNTNAMAVAVIGIYNLYSHSTRGPLCSISVTCKLTVPWGAC